MATREAIDLGLTVEEADAVAGKPMGYPEDRHLRPARPRRHRPRAAHRGVAARQPAGRRRLPLGAPPTSRCSPDDRSAASPAARARAASTAIEGRGREQDDAGDRPEDRRVPADARGAAREPRRGEECRQRHGRVAGARRAPRPRRPVSPGACCRRSSPTPPRWCPTIADEVASVDEAMRAGYSWELGPFELIDRLGPVPGAAARGRRAAGAAVARRGGRRHLLPRRGAAGCSSAPSPPRRSRRATSTCSAPKACCCSPTSSARASRWRRTAPPALWDLGDGVLCLEFHTKMNALDDGVVRMLGKAHELIDGTAFKALVIYNEGTNFSVGANIGIALFAANLAMWNEIEGSIAEAASRRSGRSNTRRSRSVGGARRHGAGRRLRDPAPLLGGAGARRDLHGACRGGRRRHPRLGRLQGDARPLVEQPEAARRPDAAGGQGVRDDQHGGRVRPPPRRRAKTFSCVPSDGITMNRDRLLADAKAKALALLADGYKPPKPVELSLPGPSGRVALEMAVDGFRQSGKATPHDEVVAKRLAPRAHRRRHRRHREGERGRPLAPRARGLHRPRQDPGTLARIEHMLDTGKPLRN